MAEYSKMAQGSFFCTSSTQPIYLPFVPDYVKVGNLNGTNNINAATGSVEYITWLSCMPQGDGIMSQQQSGGYYRNLSAAPNGVRTFSTQSTFSFGPPMQIQAMTAASPVQVTTASPHGLAVGDVVMFEGIVGMQQMAGVPFNIFQIISPTAFTVYFSANASNYTPITGSPAGAYVKRVYDPFLYAPGVCYVSSINTGSVTTVNTINASNFQIGQQVAFRMPSYWGCTQLNSSSNNAIPGSPLYGYVTSYITNLEFTVSINSSNFSPFTNNPAYFPGFQWAEVVAVGDVNTGGMPYTGGALYPSPVTYPINLTTPIHSSNGPAIAGAFFNNTRMGFSVGSSILTSGAIGTSSYYWEAYAHDYLQYNSVGLPVG